MIEITAGVLVVLLVFVSVLYFAAVRRLHAQLDDLQRDLRQANGELEASGTRERIARHEAQRLQRVNDKLIADANGWEDDRAIFSERIDELLRDRRQLLARMADVVVGGQLAEVNDTETEASK
jgi:chromosome segregation ATPase